MVSKSLPCTLTVRLLGRWLYASCAVCMQHPQLCLAGPEFSEAQFTWKLAYSKSSLFRPIYPNLPLYQRSTMKPSICMVESVAWIRKSLKLARDNCAAIYRLPIARRLDLHGLIWTCRIKVDQCGKSEPYLWFLALVHLMSITLKELENWARRVL